MNNLIFISAKWRFGRKIGKYNDKGEKVTDTQWHTVTAWGKTAEIIEKYVKKGKELAVEGKLIHRSYDDMNGEKRYITEVVVSDVLLFGPK